MAVPAKFRTRFRTPTCRNCGSGNLAVTSSQQYRMINGRRRQMADVICNDCGNQWWSTSPHVLAMARKADVERKVRDLRSGKKERTQPLAGKTARQVKSKGSKQPARVSRLV